ncbi:MAG: hypothetical protein ACK4FV_07680, partial [Candidatus Nitrosocaldus sp.]
ACNRLGLTHHRYEWLHNVMERAIQRLKDRTGCFDNHFPCRRRGCTLEHLWRWLNLSQLYNQPETLTMILNIRGMIEMA